MKLIMEGWRTFLNEVKGSSLKNDEGADIGRLLSGVVETPFLGHGPRTVVAVDVKGHGPIAGSNYRGEDFLAAAGRAKAARWP